MLLARVTIRFIESVLQLVQLLQLSLVMSFQIVVRTLLVELDVQLVVLLNEMFQWRLFKYFISCTEIPATNGVEADSCLANNQCATNICNAGKCRGFSIKQGDGSTFGAPINKPKGQQTPFRFGKKQEL